MTTWRDWRRVRPRRAGWRDHSAAAHVFGDNVVGRRLYSSLGYAETRVSMEKRLIEA